MWVQESRIYILAILQESHFCVWKYWCGKIKAFVTQKTTQSIIKYFYLHYNYLYSVENVIISVFRCRISKSDLPWKQESRIYIPVESKKVVSAQIYVK